MKAALLFLVSVVSYIGALDFDVPAYLVKYGYLPGHHFGDHDLSSAIKLLQKDAGIPVTGELNEETLKLMTQTRCGNHEKRAFDGLMFNAYSGVAGTWKKLKLTYVFINYTPDLPKSVTRRIIKQALAMWSIPTNLEFTEVTDRNADIRISFGGVTHYFVRNNNQRCPYYFDGPGGTIAHAFYPLQNFAQGAVHFDDDEYFTDKKSDGKDLLWVAAHEFGHTLGLYHSHNQKALMYPWYQFDPTLKKLPYEDQYRIQRLYGAPYRPKTTQKSTTQGADGCPSGWVKRNSACYLHSGKTGTFYEGETYCKALNAHLVSVLDYSENRFLYGITRSKRGYTWLGITDEKKESDWIWTDGSVSKYRAFKRGEAWPNRRENCAIIDKDGYWQDWPCTSVHNIHCKKAAV